MSYRVEAKEFSKRSPSRYFKTMTGLSLTDVAERFYTAGAIAVNVDPRDYIGVRSSGGLYIILPVNLKRKYHVLALAGKLGKAVRTYSRSGREYVYVLM